MSDSEVIILYDIPAADPSRKAWSPNTWKARYVRACLTHRTYLNLLSSYSLNFKGLPYKTEWVEYPDIEAFCLKLDVPPTSRKADGRPHYTLPMIYDPLTKTTVVDSAEIAKYLDKAYPSTPKLFPEGTEALQAVFLDHAWSVIGAPLFMNIILRTCLALNPRSQEYFRTTREVMFGKKLEELGSEESWKLLEAGFGKLDTWLGANGPGKDSLFLGNKICFSDIQVASFLKWTRVVCGEDSPDWERIAGWNGGKWKRLTEEFDRYAVVDA